MNRENIITAGMALWLIACGQYQNRDSDRRVETPPSEVKTEPDSKTKDGDTAERLYVQFVLPEEGDEVQGKVSVVADYAKSASRVDFFIEEQMVGSLGPNDSGTLILDTSRHADGEYRLFLVGYGPDSVVKAKRNVTIRNLVDSARASKGRIFIASPQPNERLTAGDSVTARITATTGLSPYYLSGYLDDEAVARIIQADRFTFSLEDIQPGTHRLHVTAYEIKSDTVLAADEIQIRVQPKPMPPAPEPVKEPEPLKDKVQPAKPESTKAEITDPPQPETDNGCNREFPSSKALGECLTSCKALVPEDPIVDRRFWLIPPRAVIRRPATSCLGT